MHLPIDSNEAAILGEITQASQRVAHYLQSQSERASSNQILASIRQPPNLLSVDSQTEHPPKQHSLTQTDHLEETREHIQRLEEALNQKESAINALIGERDHLNQLYGELHNAYEKLQVEFGEVKQALVGKEQESEMIGKRVSVRKTPNFKSSIPTLFSSPTTQ